MRNRQPAVAGTFYEANPARLKAQVTACFDEVAAPAERQPFIGAVVPHAGLMFSGHVAAAFYGAADLPERLIILCPNHTGFGHFAAINRAGSWRTPFGDVNVDSDLANELMSRTPILSDDDLAHAREHSLEVQLPFLQQLLGRFTFVPICLGAPSYEVCEEIGNAIADVVRGEKGPIGILASSDLNHYEDQQTTIRKDDAAIREVVALNPKGLWRVVDEQDISMCGYIPTTTMLIAAEKLGATRGQLIKHATSGDINGDYAHVVGYASIQVA